MEEYLGDLPHLVDRTQVVREYETVPPQLDVGGGLPVYELTPGRIRERTPEEVEELRAKLEREWGERYRLVYGLLGLRVVARRGGTLAVSGAFGGRELAPGEPRAAELPPPTRAPWHCPPPVTPRGTGTPACARDARGQL